MLHLTYVKRNHKYLNDAILTISSMPKNILHESKIIKCAYDRFLKTICNKVRLAIIQSLGNKPLNVTQLTRELGIHQTSVSHALKRLLECGFVFVEQKGKERVYSANTKTIMPLMDLMQSHVAKYCVSGCCKSLKR